MLPLVFALALGAAPTPANPFAILRRYEGSWSVHAEHSFSGTAHATPDVLINQCRTGTAFYSCEQILNGLPAALVIFTAAAKPGHFSVANVSPEGRANDGTELTIVGDHWTFLTTTGTDHRPTFRVENTFNGPDAIHFEMFSTPDGGKTWTLVNQGDDRRQ